MTAFLPTELRWCPKCKADFLAAVHTERLGKELVRMVMPCPDCGTAGQIKAEIAHC
jgi:ribosomal protein S27AE